jgi:D-aminoacyl-tRNA deacylase
MRAVVQRVSRAEVRIEGRVAGKIGRGFVVLIGVADGDNDADAAFLVDRIVGMRIFADDAGKMNLSIAQAGGELLVVSQFTLLADTNSGRRPSFHQGRRARRSAPPLPAFSLARPDPRC